MSDTVTFFHNPMSRGRIAHFMLEECGAPYEVKLLDFERGEHKRPEYLAKNPMGKIPTIEHRGVVVTEAAAICAYLADAFPASRLAPALDDPARGVYYRWLFFGAGCIEPALTDKALSRTGGKSGMVGYGTYDDTFAALEKALEKGPFLLGERFSAADVYVGSQVGWGLMMKGLEPKPIFTSYAARCADRPAYKRSEEQNKVFIEKIKAARG